MLEEGLARAVWLFWARVCLHMIPSGFFGFLFFLNVLCDTEPSWFITVPAVVLFFPFLGLECVGLNLFALGLYFGLAVNSALSLGVFYGIRRVIRAVRRPRVRGEQPLT